MVGSGPERSRPRGRPRTRPASARPRRSSPGRRAARVQYPEVAGRHRVAGPLAGVGAHEAGFRPPWARLTARPRGLGPGKGPRAPGLISRCQLSSEADRRGLDMRRSHQNRLRSSRGAQAGPLPFIFPHELQCGRVAAPPRVMKAPSCVFRRNLVGTLGRGDRPAAGDRRGGAGGGGEVPGVLRGEDRQREDAGGLRPGGGAIPRVVRGARSPAARRLAAPRGRVHPDPPGGVGPDREAAPGRDSHAR